MKATLTYNVTFKLENGEIRIYFPSGEYTTYKRFTEMSPGSLALLEKCLRDDENRIGHLIKQVSDASL